MNEWTQGVNIYNKSLGKLQSQAVCRDKRGVEHHVDLKDGYLYHSFKSSRPVKGSWVFSEPKRISNLKFVGTPVIFLLPSGHLNIWVCLETGGKKALWAVPDSFPDPAEEDEPEDPPVLRIRNGGFCYLNDGTIPIKLKGAAMREPLLRACGWADGWSKKSLEWYEQEVLAYYAAKGFVNFVRTDTCESPELVEHHAEFCYDHGIIWMANLFDRALPSGNIETNVKILSCFPNVILQVGNEIGGDTSDEELDKMIHWINEVNESKIGISAGGAFGAGGERVWKDEFLPKNPRPAVWSMHRPYDVNDPTDAHNLVKDHIKKLKTEFKTPVAWDEAHTLHADVMRSLAEVAFGAGLDAFCFYVFYKNYTEEKPPKVDPYFMYYEELGKMSV